MFYETASRYDSPLLPFCPYPTASDRAAWEALDGEWRRETIRLGENYLNFQWPWMSPADFMDYSRTGNRVRFEEKFFSKRLALDALVLAECAQGEGRFLSDIINGLFSICDESAWNLPAHNSYDRDAPSLPLPDLSAPVADLFACETGAVLAAAVYLLEEKLDEVSPLIVKRVRFELERRIFSPYLSRHFWWMGDGQSHMNNWTVWCTQNVLLTAFLTCHEQALLTRIFRKAARSCDWFLDEYGEDGCCDEGAQYYRHAGLCLFQILEIFNTVTGGDFEALTRDMRIRNIASYLYKVHVDGKYYVNFADCSPVAGYPGVREYLFARMTENEDMARFAAAGFQEGLPDTLLLSGENNLYYRLQNAFHLSEIRAAGRLKPRKAPDVYFPSAGLFIVRDSCYLLAVKAGDNADSHNHNDTGSFTVYKNGKPLFIDLGVESYTQKTFSSQRYEIWTMQSAWHNLPTINGQMQKDGEAYRAVGVSCDLSERRISMELSRAYPAGCGLRSFHRTAQLKTDAGIFMEDRYLFDSDSPGRAVLSLMTCEKPQIIDEPQTVSSEKDRTVCLCVKDLGSVHIKGGLVEAIEEIPIADARLKTAWEHNVYRILVSAVSDSLCLHIR